MARWAVVLFFAVGCANAEREEHPTHLDFGLSPDASDLSASLSDLGTARDQAMADQREGDASDEGMASSSDFSVEEDLEPPPALRPPVTCDLSGGVPSRLWMAGVASGGALFAARFHPSTGWQVVSVAAAPVVAEAAVGLVAGQPILVDRRAGDSVDSAAYDGCSGSFAAPSQIFAAATTLDRPSLAGGASGDIVFRGSVSADQRLYHSRSSDGTSWSAPAAQAHMLTTLNPVAVSYGGGIHALFTGTDQPSYGYLYDGAIDDGGNNLPSQIGTTSSQSSLPPAALVDGNGRLVVVWTQTDGNLEWFTRAADGTTTVGPSLFSCTSSCTVTSPLSPSLALDASGNVVVAWSGGNKLVYSSTLSGSTWSLPQQASGTCTSTLGDCESTLPPALSTGLAGDDLEMVFVRDSDGKAVHVRMQSGVWQTPAVFTSTNFLTQPSLVTSP